MMRVRPDAGTNRSCVEASFDHRPETRFFCGLREQPLVPFSYPTICLTGNCELHAGLGGENMRLRPQASLQTAMSAVLPSIAGSPVQRNAAAQASESVGEAVSDLLLASIVVLAVLLHARVSE